MTKLVGKESWPFEDPHNLAVFTVREIIRDGAPILYVCHDEDEGGWQFLTGEPVDMKDAMLVALSEIVENDPSICELAKLPIGWAARRKDKSSQWECEASSTHDT